MKWFLVLVLSSLCLVLSCKCSIALSKDGHTIAATIKAVVPGIGPCYYVRVLLKMTIKQKCSQVREVPRERSVTAAFFITLSLGGTKVKGLLCIFLHTMASQPLKNTGLHEQKNCF